MNKYTARTQYNGVLYQHIATLDPRIIRSICSVKIPEGAEYTDSLASLTVELALRGTQKKTKNQIEAYLKKHGIILSISHNGGYVHFDITVSEHNADKAFSLLEELLFESICTTKDVTDAKQHIMEELREAEDDAKLLAQILFSNTLYPKNSHYYIETLAERKANIKKYTKTEVVAFRNNLLQSDWRISTVSDTTPKKLGALIKKIAKTAIPAENIYEQHTPAPQKSLFKTVSSKTNVEVRIGNILPITPLDDEYTPFVFGLGVLGKVGGFAGRLMSTVREKEGLTYGIYAHTVHLGLETTGHWNIFTFFTGKDLEKGLSSTMREIKKIISHGVTNAELKVFKEIHRNQFLLAHESNRKRVRLYHSLLTYGVTEEMILDQNEKIATLTKAQVDNALKKYIKPNTLVITGAGPVTQKGAGIVE